MLRYRTSNSTGPNADANQALTRDRLIGLAVTTSLATKFSGILVQLAAFPMAARTLGSEIFGVYATLAASLSWISLAGIGVGPGLTLGIATSAANGDRRREARYFSSAFFITSLMTALVILLIMSGGLLVPPHIIFGGSYANFDSEIRRNLLILGPLMLFQLLVSVPEAAQAGYQKQYITNLWQMLGNILSAVGLAAAAWYWRSMTGMILAVYGLPLLPRIANSMNLLLFERPDLLPRKKNFDRSLVRFLLSTGLGFSLVSLANFLCHHMTILMVGRSVGPGHAASFAAVMRLLMIAQSITTMLTLPMFPAMADASSRGDLIWIHNTFRRVLCLALLLSGISGLILAMAGQSIIGLLYGSSVQTSPGLLAFGGLYFVLLTWESVHYTAICGLRQVWVGSIVILVRSLMVVGLLGPLVSQNGMSGAAMSLCLSAILLSSWALPLLVRRAVDQLSRLHHTEFFNPTEPHLTMKTIRS